MEQIKHSVQEDLTSIREEAVTISNNLLAKREQFLQEITEIIKNNDAIRRGLYKYGPADETFADFRVIPWGHKNLDKRSLDVGDIINANTNHKPMIDVLHDIEKELESRMTYIKETLSSFSGTEDEAFDVIQKIHKEKLIEPLNTDSTPILEKIS